MPFNLENCKEALKKLGKLVEKTGELYHDKCEINMKARMDIITELGEGIVDRLEELSMDGKGITVDKLPRDQEVTKYMAKIKEIRNRAEADVKAFCDCATPTLQALKAMQVEVQKELKSSPGNEGVKKLSADIAAAIEKVEDEDEFDFFLSKWKQQDYNNRIDLQLNAIFRDVKRKSTRTRAMLHQRLEPRKGKSVRDQANKLLAEIETLNSEIEKQKVATKGKTGAHRKRAPEIKKAEDKLGELKSLLDFWTEGMETVDAKDADTYKYSTDRDEKIQFAAWEDAKKTWQILKDRYKESEKIVDKMPNA